MDRYVTLLLASLGLASIAACGGNLTGNGSGGTSGSGMQGGAGDVLPGTGGSSSATTGGGPATGCTPQSCQGLPVTDDAKLCPDGTALGRTVCALRADGVCGWDFPECPSVPVAVDASIGPSRVPNGQCPLVPPSDPGKHSSGCSLVGRWSLNIAHDVPNAGEIEFDADGAYYGGPNGIDLTRTYAFDGAYSLDGGPAGTSMGGSLFELLYSCGDGCSGSGQFHLQFQNGCAVAILDEQVTECTGNRIVVASHVVLTRK